MEEKVTLIESLVEKAENYADSSIDLLKLKAIDKSSDMVSSLVSTLIIAAVVLCITFMVNIGAALWIGELIGNAYYGFFIVAFFYILVVIVLCIFKSELLKMPLRNSIITHIREEKNI